MSQKKWKSGPIHAVPCPKCGQKNDFRELAEHLYDPITGKPVTKQGLKFTCDHCGKESEIVKVADVTFVSVR